MRERPLAPVEGSQETRAGAHHDFADTSRLFDEEQLSLFDASPFIAPTPLAAVGSQRWMQVAVEQAPHLLLDALRPLMKMDHGETIFWRSPRALDGFREYRDRAALLQLGIHSLPHCKLSAFWPPGGPVWDALGRTSSGEYLFVEGKAHTGEIFTPATQAKLHSRWLIEQSLREAQEYFCPESRADWSGIGYQYANRLAFHYLFRTLNGLPANTVFLYFTNAGWIPRPVWKREAAGEHERIRRPIRRPELRWTQGPKSPEEWSTAIRRLHTRLGIREGFHAEGVHTIFMDVPSLSGITGIPLFDEDRLAAAGIDMP